LLEIGAATGAFLKVMANRGWTVRGIEISDEAVTLARINDQIDLFCGRLEDFTTDETFDVICMYQSLEHVADPAYVIERAYDLLNLGGIVVIEVPNLQGCDVKRSRQRRLQVYDLPLHLSHFTPKILERELRKANFTIIDVDLYQSDFIIGAIERRNSTRNPSEGYREDVVANGGGSEKAPVHPPMARKLRNWKTRVLKYTSTVFPGWRFTIVARK